ncbi:MAG: hypothetical protein NTZ15_08925 [Burkholderiales bacterium]|nr:hypothetical protein [Burkholderiales bacterium]
MARTAARRWGALGPWDALRQPLPRKLLILGPQGLGDAIALLPALRMLQRHVKIDISWTGSRTHQHQAAVVDASDFIPLDADQTTTCFDPPQRVEIRMNLRAPAVRRTHIRPTATTRRPMPACTTCYQE